MVRNEDFPWYLQMSPTFVKLYDGFFQVAEDASPLGIGDAFDMKKMTGAALFQLGRYWGLPGSAYVWDGLIYGIDNWSDVKTWTGSGREISEQFYSNLIAAKAYAYGRPYSLNTLKGVLDRVFAGETYSAEINETDMEITISLTGAQAMLEAFIQTRTFDLMFVGKPAGIKVNWEYHYE